MSIVTTAQAVPSRLYAIYASLFDSENGELKERLESWATPPSLSGRGADEDGEPSTTLFSNALQEARRLGLVEDVDNKLRITIEARGGGKKGQDAERFFREHLKCVLFDPARAVETQQSGFMLALAWFLSINPLKPLAFSEGPQIALRAEIGDDAAKTELTSINRYQNFLYWARYLGFATIVGGRDTGDSISRRAIPDPMRAIDMILPEIFVANDTLPIEEFLSRLAAIFPVFEKGSIREEYEAMRRRQPPNGIHRLSIVTSFALRRLADRRRIALDSVADAPARILDFGLREDRVSHVILKGAA